MTTATERHDWDADVATRTQTLGGGEITAILALAGATDVITFSGGFPDPATFPTGMLAEIAARLITSDPGVVLQYSAPSWPFAGTRPTCAACQSMPTGCESTCSPTTWPQVCGRRSCTRSLTSRIRAGCR